MTEIIVEKVKLLEQQIRAQLGEIEKMEFSLYPLNDPAFMEATDRIKHIELTKKYKELKELYEIDYRKLPAGSLEYVDFNAIRLQKKAEIRGLVPLFIGDEFNNNIEECYSSTLFHGKIAIEELVAAKKQNNYEKAVQYMQTYQACMFNCDEYYLGENIKSFLLSYEEALLSGKPIRDEKEEYYSNVREIEDILLAIANLKLAGGRFTLASKEALTFLTPEYRELTNRCQRLMSRCEILTSVIPKGQIEFVNLHGLRLSAISEPEIFIEMIKEKRVTQDGFKKGSGN